MKSTIFTILFITVLFSCDKQRENNSVILKPSKEMSKILNDFAKENTCEGCTYEIYIDKEDPHNYTSILYAGKQSLTSEENSNNQQEAINIVKTSNNVVFKIYSGIEYYFKKPFSEHNKVLNTVQYDNSKNAIWVVKESFGKLTIQKRNFGYPFMPLPKSEIEIKDFIIKKDSIK